MKKKIISGIFALALLLTTGYGVQRSLSNNANLSDCALANVEALAAGENSGGQTLSCWETINSQGNQTLTHKTYCGSCGPVGVHSWSDQSTCKM